MEDQTGPAFGRVFDWAIAATLGLFGGFVLAGGATLYVAIDRATALELVRDGTLESETLTDAELVDATVALTDWTGIGLMLVGLLMIGGAIAVLVVHARVRERGDSTPRWILAVAGSLISSVLSFIPFAYAVGGAVAGFVARGDRREGLLVGVLAGVIAMIPLVIVLGAVLVGLLEALPTARTGFVVGIVATAMVAAVVYVGLLSAIGGYIGAWIREQA